MTMHSGAKRSLLVAIVVAIALAPLLSWIVKTHSSNYFNGYYLGIADRYRDQYYSRRQFEFD